MNTGKASISALGILLMLSSLTGCRDKSTTEVDDHRSSKGELKTSADEAPTPPEEEDSPPAKDMFAPSSMPRVDARVPVKGPVDLTLENVKTGISECDDLVHAMNSCYLPKVAPEERDEILAAMKQERFAWTQASRGDRAGTQDKCARAMRERASILEQAGCL